MFTATAFKPTRIAFTKSTARGQLSVRCEIKEGAKVRVTAPIEVYHVGKFKDGLKLQGLEGTVVQNVTQYNGIELSANLPWKVQFEVPAGDGKPVKVLAHLDDGEIETV